MCTGHNVTVGVPESEEQRSRPRTISRTIHQVTLLVEFSLRVRLKSVLVEPDSKVRVASMRNELIGGDGFLKNNRKEPSTSRRNDIGGVPARQGWIPLKNRETVLMMHEVAVGSINASKPVRLGLPKI